MNIENKVKNTIKKYSLINKADKVLVAASGGKDSTTALFILKKLGYKVEAITIDVNISNYSKANIENLKVFCKENKIKLHEFSFRKEFGYSLCYIHSILKEKRFNHQQCTICGILRRYLINKKARLLKADKLVTGHNLDDEAQSILMNFLKNDFELLPRLGPKTGLISDKKFVPRIKPLYFIEEKEIIEYSKKHNFPVNYAPCPCSLHVYRRFILNELDELEKAHPKIKQNIIKNFIKLLPELKARRKKQAITYCQKCGEPSKKGICNTCVLIDLSERQSVYDHTQKPLVFDKI